MNNPEQTVVADDTGKDTPAETGDALDSLLNEYEEATQPKQAEPQQQSETKELLDYFKGQREADYAKQIDDDLKSAVDTVKEALGELPVKPSDRALRGILNEMAVEDPRLKNAFEKRHENPQAWGKVLKSAAKAIQEDFSYDPNLTEDREAVAAAVKSASTATEADDQYTHESLSKKSDTEFEIWKASLK